MKDNQGSVIELSQQSHTSLDPMTFFKFSG